MASAPQHPCPRGTRTRTPARWRRRAAARLVLSKAVSATQPVSSTAVPRGCPSGSSTSGRRKTRVAPGSAATYASHGLPRRRARRRTHRAPPTSRSGANAARRSAGVVSTAASARRPQRAGAGRKRSTYGRAASISAPYSTPDGQAVSHARQPRQRSRCRMTSAVGTSWPSSSARIKWMRPRGESASMPSST